MEPPRDHVKPEERTSNREQEKDKTWRDLIHSGIGELTPANKGWILAFVIIFGILQVTNYLSEAERAKADAHREEQLISYFTIIENNRQVIENHRSEEVKKLQEIVKEMIRVMQSRKIYEQ